MTPDMEKALQELLDKQAITECLHRYTRGVDRADKALMQSAYHPDAVDDHGTVVLKPGAFCDWAIAYHRDYQICHHHSITNIVIDLDGDKAHTECYWTFFGHNREKPNTLAFGRYLDRLEKRNGKWGIVTRVCMTEAVCEVQEANLPAEWAAQLAGNGVRARDKSDSSYARPLTVTRSLTG